MMKLQNKIRLGVNIDHVATLRQARGTNYPSVIKAARTALLAGADQITIHLREDRRHIQDTDVFEVKKITDEFQVPLNLEMGTNEDILAIAMEVRPGWICLVPEKREERTTEGGLDLILAQNFDKIASFCHLIASHLPETKISLFIEAREEVIKKAMLLPIHAVEIHTGEYAHDYLCDKPYTHHLDEFKFAKKLLENTSISYHAGHGLTPECLAPLVALDVFSEYNIGHYIISESLFVGLSKSVQNILNVINKR